MKMTDNCVPGRIYFKTKITLIRNQRFTYNKIEENMQFLSEKLQQIMPKKKLDIFGKDSLLNSSIPYYLIAILINVAILMTDVNIFMFIFIGYTGLPLLDQFLSFDVRNPNEQERRKLEARDLEFKIPLYVSVISDWVLFFKVLQMFADIELSPSSILRTVGLIFIFASLQTAQFGIAHEIFHKPGLFHKLFGTIHMVKNLYMHFTYEHLYGHHRRVATPEDPASAEKGMSVYRFFIKSLIGSWKSVYKMEVQQKKPFYQNYAILSLVASIAFTSLIFKTCGCQVGLFYLFSTFQAINYVEHYGLRRQKNPDGSYQKVSIKHSWNAPHRFTNYFLFKVQRHSDHHENSSKPYQTLVSMEQSPQLPHGYTVCLFLSYFPSEWKKIMDPLVDSCNKPGYTQIDEDLMQNSVKETRKFIIKLGFFTTALFVGSLIF